MLAGLLLMNFLVEGQEKICIPRSLISKKVTGTIYLNNGDSISGVFENLTPVNDILTTHIIVDSAGAPLYIPRVTIGSYFDEDKNEKRYKVYPDDDKVYVKKQCHYDLGIFMLLLVDGPYKLLSDKLRAKSSIQAYSQSTTSYVYYLITPDDRFIKIIINDIKPQLQSLLNNYPGVDQYFSDPEFDVDTVVELIRMVNSIIQQE
jgi:hypothetical protein